MQLILVDHLVRAAALELNKRALSLINCISFRVPASPGFDVGKSQGDRFIRD